MENIDEKLLKDKIVQRLKNIYDPEIPVDIYSLGLIYDIEFEYKDKVIYAYVTMTLTSPGCPVADSLLEQVKYVTQSVDEVFKCYVDLVFTPTWDRSMVSEEAKEILELSGF